MSADSTPPRPWPVPLSTLRIARGKDIPAPATDEAALKRATHNLRVFLSAGVPHLVPATLEAAASHGGDKAETLAAALSAAVEDPECAPVAKGTMARIADVTETEVPDNIRELTVRFELTVIPPEKREEYHAEELKRHPPVQVGLAKLMADGSPLLVHLDAAGRACSMFGSMVGFDHDNPGGPKLSRLVAIYDPAEHTGFTRSWYYAGGPARAPGEK